MVKPGAMRTESGKRLGTTPSQYKAPEIVKTLKTEASTAANFLGFFRGGSK